MSTGEVAQHLLLATAVIVVAAHLGGWVAQRVGQPQVLGEITAGILLGPSALGALWPEATAHLFPTALMPSLRALAEVGLVLFMFMVGLDLDHRHLRGQGHRAVVISHSSIIAPFALGVGVGYLVHDHLAPGADALPFALFVGAAMAVTAFPVLARILVETGLDRTRVGAMALACAAVDDVTAWCVLAAVVAVANDDGVGAALVPLAQAVGFALAMWLVVRPLLAKAGDLPLPVVVAMALASAWFTDAIGIHAIFGAFLAGAIVPRSGGAPQRHHAQLEPVVAGLLLPVFFMVVGLSTRIGLVDTPRLWALTGVVIAAAVAGKLGGAGLAARAMGWTWRDAWSIGLLMNARGLTEIVILTVGLERGLISPTMFTVMVLMALVTTFMTVPALRLVGAVPSR